MPHHTIASVARLTGLAPPTIRAWEARYRVLEPRRDAHGRRLYSNEHVRRLRILAEATRHGHRIGEIARLSEARLLRLIATPEGGARERGLAALRHELLAAVADYDMPRLRALLGAAARRLPSLELVRSVLGPLLHEVGERWCAGQMSIAQEHLLCSSVQGLLYAELQRRKDRGGGAPVVCGTLSGERHDTGALLMAYLASTLGHEVYFAGASLPAEELRRIAARARAALVAVSVVTDEAAAALPAQLQALASGLAPGVQLVVGGRSSAAVSRAQLPAPCRVLGSAEALLEALLAG